MRRRLPELHGTHTPEAQLLRVLNGEPTPELHGPHGAPTSTEGFQASPESRLHGEECCENLCSSTAQSAQGFSSSAADLAHGLSSIGRERMKPVDHVSRERPRAGATGASEPTIDERPRRTSQR